MSKFKELIENLLMEAADEKTGYFIRLEYQETMNEGTPKISYLTEDKKYENNFNNALLFGDRSEAKNVLVDVIYKFLWEEWGVEAGANTNDIEEKLIKNNYKYTAYSTINEQLTWSIGFLSIS